MSRIAMTLFLCLSMAGVAGQAGAQFLQYTPPGGPEEKPDDRREDMERQIVEADRRLGRIYIAPWAALYDAAYVRNLFSTEEQSTPNDFTATVGAGFRAYLRNGPKAVWRAQILPEYVWWSRQPERRQVNGRYTLGFHGFFNRLTLEVQGGREQRQRIVTPEVPVPITAREDGGELLAEVELSHAFSAFTSSSINRQKNLIEVLDQSPRVDRLALLNREDRLVRAGFRWQPREAWSLALGAEATETSFDSLILDRSNSGIAPVAELQLENRRLSFALDLASRSLKARRSSSFVDYEGVTGKASVTLGNRSRLSSSIYVDRNLLYSLSPDYAYLTDERLGLVFNMSLRQRIKLRLYVETGTDDYTAYRRPAGIPEAPRRREDVFTYGASTSLRVGRRASIGLEAIRTEFDSNLPGDDRSYTSVGTTFNLLGFTAGDR